MKTIARTASAFVISGMLAGSLAGCAQGGGQGGFMGMQGVGNGAGFGTLLGAAGGGLLGAQFGNGTGKLIATAAGTLVGGFIGNRIGAGLDESERNSHQIAAMQALSQAPVGGMTSWSNPANGNRGQVQITNQFQQPMQTGMGTMANTTCREYTQTIVVGGQAQQAVGRACQRADGTWQIQNG